MPTDTIPCLSLWQPWASLWAHGLKIHETRGRDFRHRGDIAVHAARKWNREIADICWREPFRSAIKFIDPRGVCDPGSLPFGAIVGLVNITTCEPIHVDNAPPSPDLDFGDYTVGRFMIHAENFRPFATPIPYIGHQGLFRVPLADLAGATR